MVGNYQSRAVICINMKNYVEKRGTLGKRIHSELEGLSQTGFGFWFQP